ncbi:MAG TPA: 23S rRNA (uracil(1939)-C(5))-methyltransferase RlmD [Bacteroidia bacterium]|nr:23S rRNA (uracil(1939)-C(5))-methyltransferase RlmD [Bacteroidia bacterium]
MKVKDIFNDIEITGTTVDGLGIARIDSWVVFIPKVMEGDVADIIITSKKRNHVFGKVVELKKSSEQRVTPFCEHFGLCGGCSLQHIDYAEQLRIKQKFVEDTLQRIGKVGAKHVSPIIPCAETTHYRNRLDFAFASRRWLANEELSNPEIKATGSFAGFHVPGRFDKIIDINTCHLQPESANTLRHFVKNFAVENGWTFYDTLKNEGFIRDMIIRNTTTGEWMVIVIFNSDENEKINSLMQALTKKFPEITSLNYVINPKKNSTIYDLEVNLFSGRKYLLEEIGGLKFKISPKSFFQTNTKQAAMLYHTALQFASLTGTETVYDLYTGTGTIANYVAGHCKKVIGIDSVPDAIEDAKENSRSNNIHNTEFFAGDIKETLSDDFISVHGKPDVIITDPPRVGMHPDVVKKMSETGVTKIVYVSCNPATQARDIALLSENYSVTKIQPVDMFPHTSHVENVALLERKYI